MNTAATIFTILFEDSFWILLCERFEDGRYEVCKITFGAEPKEYDVYDYLLKNWHTFKFGSTRQEQAAAGVSPKPKAYAARNRKANGGQRA